MTIDRDLFLAILAMDSYNRGYGEGIEDLGGQGTQLGNATIIRQSDVAEGSSGVTAGFYAIAYNVSDVTGLEGYSRVISYRGTNATLDGIFADITNGWDAVAGFPGSA